MQRILFRLEREMLGPYETPSNRLAKDMYENLPLPWELRPRNEGFSPKDFVRITWDRDGVLNQGTEFVDGNDEVTLEDLERQLGTASMVTRWRSANPDLTGEDDCVAVTIRDLSKALDGQKSNRGRQCSESTTSQKIGGQRLRFGTPCFGENRELHVVQS